MDRQIAIPIASADAPLALVGGKGRALAKLAVAGFAVPDGFLVSTHAYGNFVDSHQLQNSILDIVAAATGDQISSALAESKIRSLFESASVPTETEQAILQAYSDFGEADLAVSVRSSATAEDLPDFSFAGQHDSYLNVRGAAALLEAIRNCWASLWTARAIVYREQKRIDQATVAMGVVVQRMVQSDVSGIVFTANPTTGDRTELVINASFGLGEAIVGGQVTPDTYGVRTLAQADAAYWFDVAMVLGAAKVTDGLLNRFLRYVRGGLSSALFLRGFPSTALKPPMDLEAIAMRISDNSSLRDRVINTPASDLLVALESESLGSSVVNDLKNYFEQYGHLVYTLDFVEPTQGEYPRPVLLNLKSLVGRRRFDTASRQRQMAAEREANVDSTLKSLGPFRRWLFRTFLRWAQTFGPYREDALFYMGAGWPTLRRLALELGRRLVESGSLTVPDDVFYLETTDLVSASNATREGRACVDLKRTADEQRGLREARKKLHPPGMLPVGSRFKFGPFDFSAFETQKKNDKDSNILNGFAVSPGKVTGEACVILSPSDFETMQPDTILVCPTTTPAWTPLFTNALGLVTDIGGILAHGSIVAREYGIPAVLGTGNATRRIISGQRITVDGDKGTVTLGE